MGFTRDAVYQCVVETLHGMVGVKDTSIVDSTDQINGLGMVSDDGLDFACEVSDRLGFHFPDDLNPFVDDSGRRPRRVREIVELILPMLQDSAEVPNG